MRPVKPTSGCHQQVHRRLAQQCFQPERWRQKATALRQFEPAEKGRVSILAEVLRRQNISIAKWMDHSFQIFALSYLVDQLLSWRSHPCVPVRNTLGLPPQVGH